MHTTSTTVGDTPGLELALLRRGLDDAEAATERAASSIDEAMEPIEASEERTAAMEAEAMKGPRR